MICPKCKNKNHEENVTCEHCGFKLKLSCSKCKSLNKVGQVKCSGCGKELLKVCSQCKALNNLKSQVCRKCSAELNEVKSKSLKKTIESPPQEIQDLSLDEYAVLSVNLINLSTIKAKVPKQELLKKIVNKFYQSYAKQAKINAEKARKHSVNTMVIEFKNSVSLASSVEKAITSAYDALKDIQEFNNVLSSKLGIDIKIKTGIDIVNKGSLEFAVIERKLARASEIVVSSKIIENAKDHFIFEEARTQSGELYYKLSDIAQSEEIQESQDEIQVQSTIQPPEDEPVSAVESEIKTYARTKTYETLVNKINETTDGQVISLQGEDGIGKSFVLNNLRNAFEKEKIFWLYGQCYPVNDYLPYAFFKNLFKSLFGLPANNLNVDESKANVVKILSEKMNIDNSEIQQQVLSIIFPDKNNLDSHILVNKEKTIQAIQTVIASICDSFKTVLIIEDFEYIDPASLECIKRMLSSGMLASNIKILISTKINKKIQDILNLDVLNDMNTLNIGLGKFSTTEIDGFLDSLVGDKNILPEGIRNQIIEKSQGFPIYVEEVIMLLMQTGAVTINPEKHGEFVIDPDLETLTLPDNVQDIIKLRLNNIAQMSANAFKIVCYASILGFKFMPVLVKTILEIPDEEFKELIELLLINGIITGYDEFNFIFKNRTIWEAIYHIETSQDNKVACFMGVNQGLLKHTLTDNAIIAENAQKVNLTPQYILNFIEQAAQESYSIGDDSSYIELRKEFLNFVDKTDMQDKEQVKNSIKEELAKLGYFKQPNEAIKFLSELIRKYEEENNIEKVIDLSGFMAKSCEIIGNYVGAIESTDKALENVEKQEMPYEFALLNYAKLEHLMNMGRLEELIVLAKTEVLPTIEDMLASKKMMPGMNIQDLQYIDMDTKYILAKSLAMQGNKECMPVAEILSKTANESEDVDYVVKAQLVAALFKSLQGYSAEVKAILEAIKEVIPGTADRAANFTEWHFINILNNLFMKDLDIVKNDIGGLINFTMNTGAYFYQPLTKAVLGKIFQYEKKYDRATDIYYDLIHFSSENKLATAAMAIWYFITESEMDSGNKDKAMAVAQKAHEVSQNPSINNIFFTVLFKKILAELHLDRAELDMAGMYAEQAIQLAQQSELKLWEVKLLMLCGKILRKTASLDTEDKKTKVEMSYKMYLNALEQVKTIPNKGIVSEIEACVNELNQYCAKEGIKV